MKTRKTPKHRSAPAVALQGRQFRRRVVPDRRRKFLERQAWKDLGGGWKGTIICH